MSINTDSINSSTTELKSEQMHTGNSQQPPHQMGFFEESLYKWRHLRITKVIIFRLIFFVIVLTMEIINNFSGYLLPKNDVDCIEDKLFNVTTGVNNFFSEHLVFKKIVMIFSSLLVDIYVLTSFLNYVLFSKSTKFLFSLVSVYILLIFIRLFFNNGIPDDFLFDYPGFPSIFVPYYKTSSFFFSPTISILVLCCLEWDRSKLKRTLMLSIGICLTLFEIFLMFSLRKHFTCDIFTSVTLAHFIYILSERYSDFIIYDCILKRKSK